MPTYVGFSTIDANKPKTTRAQPGVDGGTGSILQPIILGKKYRMVDGPLVLRDFINALNIKQGEKVGNPGYGTDIWSYIFEPNDADSQFRIQTEIQRVASQDPRLIVNDVKAFVQQNGILLEVEIAVQPFNDAEVINLFFNNTTNTASMQT
jgi:phage baseplate assembly protein W